MVLEDLKNKKKSFETCPALFPLINLLQDLHLHIVTWLALMFYDAITLSCSMFKTKAGTFTQSKFTDNIFTLEIHFIKFMVIFFFLKNPYP